MKKTALFLLLGCLVFFSGAASKAQSPVVENGRSPAGDAIFVKEERKGYAVYVLQRNGKRVLLDSSGDVSNLVITAFWSPDGESVALLTQWGTKMSNVEIFRKTARGVFAKLSFDDSHIEKKMRDGREVETWVDVGYWLDASTVQLGFVGADLAANRYYLISYQARIENGKAHLINQSKPVRLSEKQLDKILDGWKAKRKTVL